MTTSGNRWVISASTGGVTDDTTGLWHDRGQLVGWISPTGRANARPMTGSSVIHTCFLRVVFVVAGYAFANPPCNFSAKADSFSAP